MRLNIRQADVGRGPLGSFALNQPQRFIATACHGLFFGTTADFSTIAALPI
jgi:hypothetical protein